MRYFHGTNRKNSYFEGFYFKHQSKNKVISFIPAFHIDKIGNHSSSIQVITDTGSYDFKYSVNEFKASKETFSVSVGQNIFTSNGIYVNLKSDKFSVEGELVYGKLTPLKYDIMGPFRHIPFMQCNHGIISLNHTINGLLYINGERISFNDSTGYIEKDWGNSFPKSYIWTQCSTLEPDSCCIVFSTANIPFAGFSFNGCICCVYYKGYEYRLATYHGVKIEKCDKDEIVIHQGKYLLKINVLNENPLRLNAPELGSMTRHIYESVACKARYRFYISNKLLFDFSSEQAGFEYCEK